MAIDQTEAMIAAIKAQLEKERAAEAAKQKRLEEEEALKNLSNKKKKSSDSGSKGQYKTLSAEELARIEEKKRRKREEALGIVHEDKPEEPENVETADKTEENKETESGLKAEKEAENKEAPKISLNLGGIADEGLGCGLGSGLGEGLGGLGEGLGGGLGRGLGGGLGDTASKEGLGGLGSGLGGGLGSTAGIHSKLDDSIAPSKVKGADKTTLSNDAERFDEDDMTSVDTEETEWTPGKNVKVKEVKTQKGSDKNGDLFSILPDRNKDGADTSSCMI